MFCMYDHFLLRIDHQRRQLAWRFLHLIHFLNLSQMVPCSRRSAVMHAPADTPILQMLGPFYLYTRWVTRRRHPPILFSEHSISISLVRAPLVLYAEMRMQYMTLMYNALDFNSFQTTYHHNKHPSQMTFFIYRYASTLGSRRAAKARKAAFNAIDRSLKERGGAIESEFGILNWVAVL